MTERTVKPSITALECVTLLGMRTQMRHKEETRKSWRRHRRNSERTWRRYRAQREDGEDVAGSEPGPLFCSRCGMWDMDERTTDLCF